jgi:hypothetical protein
MGKKKPSDAEALIIGAREEGRQEGYLEGLTEMLKWLEDAYLNPKKRPVRGTEEGEAILKITRAAGRHLRKLISKAGAGKEGFPS